MQVQGGNHAKESLKWPGSQPTRFVGRKKKEEKQKRREEGREAGVKKMEGISATTSRGD
jgi:hypothetical protein